MLRFRTTADENLYLALRTELYVAAAQLGDPALTSLIMRNFGKLEALVQREGVRQALAAATISRIASHAAHSSAGPQMNEEQLAVVERLAFMEAQDGNTLFANVYGSSDTPLSKVEAMWLDRMQVPAEMREHPWLDTSPLRFPAMTYAEAMGIEQPKPPMYKVDAPHAPTPMPQQPAPAPRAPVMDQELTSLFDDDPGEAPSPGPDQLAHYRDAMVAMKTDGVVIGSWSELILSLAMRLGEDAGFIDLALGTEPGRLMMQQAGYGDVQPGTAVVMDRFVGEIPGQQVDVLPPTPVDPPAEAPAPPPDAIE